jgi:hypothetical protein
MIEICFNNERFYSRTMRRLIIDEEEGDKFKETYKKIFPPKIL